ncbi:MAG: proline dehydrogenase family protein [Acidobacteria bacterium]|nr:proline dehydrogenase family protein [Acidobacteriota bacterium]MBS1864662.1 proline dehydrogenase family protein [Acidobacteriota bacterium]
MSVMRSLLLAASQNRWLRERATKYKFVRRSVSRFMPGEEVEDAIGAAKALESKGIAGVFTRLGENITDIREAEEVTQHYVEVLSKIRQAGLRTEISVKLTQLGLDQSAELCAANVKKIVQAEDPSRTVWIDMEASNYVGATLDVYRRVLAGFPRTGICLQAYLFRTKKDLEDLFPLKPSVRLVKGAYKEPREIAYPSKKDVDENYFSLGQEMLRAQRDGRMVRAAFGTHDPALVQRLGNFIAKEAMLKNTLEIQMLYGIQRAEQERLAAEGYRSGVLVAYGSYWYPWFVRRLAERPANLWFMLKNLFAA